MNSSTEDHGGLDYFIKHLNTYLPYSILCNIFAWIGVIGNLFVMFVVASEKKLRVNPTFILIFNLAMGDFMISAFANWASVFTVLIGKNFFRKYPPVCYLIGSVCWIACLETLLTIGFISINRYVYVFNRFEYNSIFSVRKTIFLCFLAWIIAFILNIPHFTGWGGIVYDLKTLACVYDRLKKSFVIPLTFVFILLPCLLIGICYVRIFWFHYHVKAKNRRLRGSVYSQVNETIQFSKCLFASFVLYAVCWIPVAITNLFDADDSFSKEVHVYSILAAHMNSALNPCFYALFSNKIRRGYKKIFNKITCSQYFQLSKISYDLY